MSLIELWKERPFTLIGSGKGICVKCGNKAELLGSYLFELCDSCIGGPSLIINRSVNENTQVTLDGWF